MFLDTSVWTNTAAYKTKTFCCIDLFKRRRDCLNSINVYLCCVLFCGLKLKYFLIFTLSGLVIIIITIIFFLILYSCTALKSKTYVMLFFNLKSVIII